MTSKYETEQEADVIGDLSKRLQDDLRQAIHSLGSFRPFSDRWMTMSDALARIGHITKMEVTLPKESKDATLWDCDELALRFLLEDGKLNLVLRNLIAFKTLQFDMLKQGKAPKEDFKIAALKFEIGTGVTLKHAWLHIEALQTTDLPMMVEYISTVISMSNDKPERLDYGFDDDEKRAELQEKIFPYYILALCKGMEESIDEERIMPSIRRFQLVPLFIKYLTLHAKHVTKKVLSISCEALAILFDTDDYQTNEEKYLTSDNVSIELGNLGDTFIYEMSSEDSELRRKIRPLLDEIRNHK
jgi:hypothetical protein